MWCVLMCVSPIEVVFIMICFDYSAGNTGELVFFSHFEDVDSLDAPPQLEEKRHICRISDYTSRDGFLPSCPHSTRAHGDGCRRYAG